MTIGLYSTRPRRVSLEEELTLTEQGIQQILAFLGLTVLPAARGATPNQFYDTRILERMSK